MFTTSIHSVSHTFTTVKKVVKRDTDGRLHMGSTIRTVLEKRGISQTRFGELVNLSRAGVQKMLQRKDCYIHQLLLVSKALEFDFFKLLSEEMRNMDAVGVSEPMTEYTPP